MKKSFLLILMLGMLATMVNAQEWQTDFEKAKDLAAQKNLDIVLVFQGSDWCAPCIKLENEIWSSDEFISLAKDHFVMLKADFPRKRRNALPPEQQKKNQQLAEKYNQSGYFPFVVVLDKNGKVLGQTGYKKLSPKEYYDLLLSFTK